MSKRNGSRKRQRPVADLSKTEKLRFSFEYYDTACDEFCLSRFKPDQIRKALARLKDINSKTHLELRAERHVYHFNQVEWDQTIKKDGFPDSRLEEWPAFHFALVGVNKQKARVYGAYYQGTFYIVWFDLNHEIWPSRLKHT